MAYQYSYPGSEKNIGSTERMLSVASGAMMLLSGLWGVKRSPVRSFAKAATGAFLIYRGAKGYCFVNNFLGRNTATGEEKKSLEINEVVVVNKPRQQVYAYWRKLENLPKFMKHLKSVYEFDATHSHWEARIPAGMGTLEWDAKISLEIEGEALAWHSEENATVINSGEVAFTDVPGDATIVRVKILYSPPAGEIGAAVASMFNKQFEEMIRADMQRFKEVIEAGEERS